MADPLAVTPAAGNPAPSPTSPTGKALVPPTAVPYIGAVLLALGALAAALPPGQASHWLSVGLSVLGPVVGVLCPGLRGKPP